MELFDQWKQKGRDLWKKALGLAERRSEPIKERSRQRARSRLTTGARPATLEERYQPEPRKAVADEAFERLRRRIFNDLERRERERRGAAVFREAGRIAPGRPFFYLKPLNRAGWLFERSGAGWVISPAERIVERDLFLREGEPVDHVTLYTAADRPGFPRVKSQALGEGLIAFAVYEEKLLEQLGLRQASRGVHEA